MNNNEINIIKKTQQLINDLKVICNSNGIGNSPSEYKIITEVFLYKFLNDKFLYEIKKVDENLSKLEKTKDVEIALNEINNKDEYELLLFRLKPDTAKLKIEHLISFLFSHQNDDDFFMLFDNTLIDIANFNIDIFSLKTGGKEKIRLFEGLSQHITEKKKKNTFCKAIINKLIENSFEDLFEQKYDVFSIIFEYLIKDYNKDFGKYAEYYTPNSIARIISRILVAEEDLVKNVTVYDPAAGSGTLVLALAHQIGEENCTIYTQDISQKSNEFLRLNLILNNLVHSLGNVVHGNTLTEPAHYNESRTELAKFNYIVSNPPFNVDFSDFRDALDTDIFEERFWAGIPKIPEKDKKSMQIYLLFIQHILNSLKDGGKSAIVIPTPFLTKGKGIENKIRKKLIDDKLLRAVISMPKNIFATTGTNVSVLIVENSPSEENVFFIDASNLGDKSSDTERNQRTILSLDDQEKIVKTYKEKKIIDKFSASASFDKIKKSEYRLSPNTYFEHKIKVDYLKRDEFEEKINSKLNNLKLIYSRELEEILDVIFNYWFVQFDFLYNGKPYKSSGGAMVYNSDLDTNIPIGWKVEDIQKVCKIVDCLHSKKPDETYEDENCYLLQSENIMQDGKIDVTKKYYISKSDYSVWSSKIEIKENDFIITNAGRAGAIGMVPKDIKCAIGRNMTAIRACKIHPYYFRQFLFSPYMNKFVASNLDEGSFFKSFNVKSIKKIKVLIPEENVLKEYIQMIEPFMYKLVNGISSVKEINRIKNIIEHI